MTPDEIKMPEAVAHMHSNGDFCAEQPDEKAVSDAGGVAAPATTLREAFAKVYPNDDALLALAENNRDHWLEAIGARHKWAAFQHGAAAANGVQALPPGCAECGRGEVIDGKCAPAYVVREDAPQSYEADADGKCAHCRKWWSEHGPQGTCGVRGWRPLDTAPTDGEFILLLGTLNFPKEGHRELPFTGRWFNGMWVIVNADMAIQRIEPKGWMPLPPHGVKGGGDVNR
jgi:hypothetical protein